jgi:hypothetical protein
MTSRFALLTAIAGTIGLSCSGGDSNSGPPAPPAVAPNFVTNPSSNTTSNANTSQNTPTPVALTNTPNTNTEQMAPVTPPPATNTQTAAGTGGTGGGSTPPPTTGTAIPTGTGNAITPTAGHVAGTSNGVGIQGDFYTFSDADPTNVPPGTTTIMPKDFSMALGSQICASGSASQIMNGADGMPAYGQYYGGGIGFNLGDPGGGAGPQPWAQGKVVGFSFNVTGSTIPTNMRFQAKFYSGSALSTSDAYCTLTVKSGANTVMFSSLLLDCYNGANAGGPLPATVLLQSIQWQVATVTTAATPFNFCIDSLTAITSP